MADPQEIWRVPTTWPDEVEHRRRLAEMSNRLVDAHALPTRYAWLTQPTGLLAIIAPTGLTAPARASNVPWINFEKSTTAGLVTSFMLPPEYQQGQPVRPSLRWFKPSGSASLTGSVVWWSRYRIYPVDVSAPALSSSATGSGVQSATAGAARLFEVVWGDITSLTGYGQGTVIEFQIGRKVDAAGDSFSGTAQVASIELSIPTDARGGDEPHSKYTE